MRAVRSSWCSDRLCAALAAVGVLLVLVVPMRAGAAATQAGFGERLESLQIVATVTSDGDLDVRERIVWDFGSAQRHGIFRYIPERHAIDPSEFDVPDRSRTYERVTTVEWQGASSPSGAPAGSTVLHEDGNSVLRIGDPDRTVTGRHTYEIGYRIDRAVLNGLLQFVAVGPGWTVPVDRVDITLNAPLRAGAEAVCQRLDPGVSCAVERTTSGVHVLTSGIGIELEVPLDGSVRSPEPLLETPHRLSDGFTTSGLPGAAGAAALLGAGVAAVAVGRKGRDRVFASGAALGSPGDADRPRRMRERLASPVEFEPPEGIRPGLIEPAWRGEAPPEVISCTLVDLAARGVLRIEPDSGGSYELELTGAELGSRTTLTPNESHLLDVLFGGATGRVSLKALEQRITLASQIAGVRSALLHEAVERGWWVSNPVNVRARWRFSGLVALGLGGAATYFLAGRSRFGLVGLAIVLFGLGVLAFAQVMPVRTATGSRIAARLRGFRLLFSAGEGERQRLMARDDLFAEYLPYAMAFGCVDRWVKTFQDLGVEPAVPYFGPVGFRGPMMWGGPGGFDRAMSDFDRSLSRSIEAGAAAERARQAAANRSSGSSGGGSFGGGGSSGGGGGGSW